MRRVWRPTGLLIGSLILASVGAGCGKATTTLDTVTGQGTSATSPVRTSSGGAGGTSTSGTGTSTSAAEARHEGPGTAPKEIQIELRVARADLKRRGIPYTVQKRHPSQAPVESSWMVCETAAAPRSHLESGTSLGLIVAPSCR
jgi:hypothetical protein